MESMRAIKVIIESRIAAEEKVSLDSQIITMRELIDKRATALKRRGSSDDDIGRRQLPFLAILRTLSQLRAAADYIEREPPELLPHIVRREREIGARELAKRLFDDISGRS